LTGGSSPRIWVGALAAIVFLASAAVAQKNPVSGPYSVVTIRVAKFDKATGEFASGMDMGADTLFNELDLSLFAVVEIEGAPGAYAAGRRLSVTVTEGRKVVLRTFSDIGVLNENGRYFVPILLPGPYCSDVRVSVRISGQTKQAAASRKLPFVCGE
jgi:hypothetical protein